MLHVCGHIRVTHDRSFPTGTRCPEFIGVEVVEALSAFYLLCLGEIFRPHLQLTNIHPERGSAIHVETPLPGCPWVPSAVK